MSCRSGLILPATLLITACNSSPQPAVERIAVITFDNQTPDPSAAWVGDAVAQTMVAQLSGAPSLAAVLASNREDASREHAARVVMGYVANEGVELRAHAALRTAAGKHLRDIEARAHDPAGLAHALARALWPDAPDQPTANAEALRLFAEGARSRNARDLRASIAASPGFGPARLALVQVLSLGGDREAARAAIHEAAADPALDAATHARFVASEAAAAGPAERLATLEKLAALTPAHPEAFIQAAGAAMALRQFGKGAAHLETATRLDPASPDPWNELGYARAFGGDLRGATDALAVYGRLVPASGNPLDSVGEVNWLHGHFAEAERAFLEAYEKSPGLLRAATLRKAAEARLIAGDRAGAQPLFERYRDAVASSPLATLSALQWKWSTGDEAGAMAEARALARESKSSLAWSQLAIWLTAEGKPEAAEAAEAAVKIARTPAESANGAIAAFVSQADTSVEEWKRRSESAPGPLRNRALAWALILHKHYADAVPVLEKLSTSSGLIEFSQWRALAGWASREAGDKVKAKELLAQWPVPSSEGTLFDSLIFPAVATWRVGL
ncbi:MAG: hypothetical protein R2729_09815 [Bryobacteraceae bacterium]